MASSCLSTCINDARLPVAIRPTYVNLYKWPESDVEFVRSRSSNGRPNTHTHACTRTHAHAHTYTHARVVDSLSCRQMYLRSYTFSRKKERVHEKIARRVKVRVLKNSRKKKGKAKNGNKRCVVIKRKKCVVLRKAKEASYAALLFMLRRLLTCTAKVDVADNDHHHHLHDQGHG